MTRIDKNGIISFVAFIFTWYGQSSAQWQQLNLPSTLRVNTIALNDSIIFAGTDGDGIFASTDNGDTWRSMNTGLQSNIVHSIFINGRRVFAGTETGASISTNYGLSWDTMNTGLSAMGVWSFGAGSTNPDDSTLFAGTWSGVYTSNDNGKHWVATGLSQTSMPVQSLSISGFSMFAATLGGGVFYSPYRGFSWTDISVEDIDQYTGTTARIPVYALAILDTTVIAGAGPGYLYLTSYFAPKFQADHRVYSGNAQVLCFALHDAQLFAGNSIGQIFMSNFGWDWQKLSYTVTGHALYSLALNASSVFAGTESGIWRLQYPITGASANDDQQSPTGFALEQNYPNPFNSSTRIKFTIPSSRRVSLKVYNILGMLVDDLVDKTMTPGTYEVEFSASDLPSGVLFYSLVTQEYRITRKLVLLK